MVYTIMGKRKLDKASTEPLYLQLMHMLKETVGSNAQDVRLPSERQLAETHGVSRMTARQALKKLGEELILESTVGRGTFIKSDTWDLNSIRFIFPADWSSLSESPFYSHIFSAAEKKSREHECDLIFSTLNSDSKLISRLKPSDAVILVSQPDRSITEQIWKTGCKMCVVDSFDDDINLGWDQVDIDNKQGSEIAADMFFYNKHQRCAYIGPDTIPLSSPYKLRKKFFVNRIKQHGLSITEKDCFKMDWYDDGTEAVLMLEKLITGNYSAVYAGHYQHLTHIMRLAKERGLKKELSFIGFSDDLMCQNMSLNTIGIMEAQIGEIAIEQVINSHRHGQCLEQRSLVSTYYIDRGSVYTQ